MGFEFSDQTYPFAVYNCVQALVAFVFLIIEAFLPDGIEPVNYYNVVYVALLLAYAIVACASTYFFKFREKLSHVPSHPHNIGESGTFHKEFMDDQKKGALLSDQN